MPEKILKFLKERGPEGEFKTHSGPFLSKSLGITRAAIWKQITFLREKGFVIESGKQGYRLSSLPEISAEELALLVPGKKIIFKKETASTNDLAIRTGEKSAVNALVVADGQSAGKGRLGRSWHSPAGLNIHMSILFRPAMPPRKSPLFSLAAAVSAALAIKGHTGLGVKLKWPNDLLANGKKIGGILLELRADPDRILFAVAGIGINVNAGIKDLPKENSATSVLIETGRKTNRAALIAAIQKEFDYWLSVLAGDDIDTLLKTYKPLSDTIGKDISVHTEGEIFEGRAIDIDEEGRLLLLRNNKIHRFSTGDVLKVRGNEK